MFIAKSHIHVKNPGTVLLSKCDFYQNAIDQEEFDYIWLQFIKNPSILL